MLEPIYIEDEEAFASLDMEASVVCWLDEFERETDDPEACAYYVVACDRTGQRYIIASDLHDAAEDAGLVTWAATH